MLDDIYKNKKVLITGHTGFKGSWLTTWLLKLGAKVFGISKDIPTTPSMFEILKLKKKIKHYRENICCLQTTRKIIMAVKPDFIFHLAAQPIVSVSYKEPIDTIMSNVVGTANILESLKCLSNKCNVVIVTSDKCYENTGWDIGYRETDKLGGNDIYSSSKAAAELITKAYYRSFYDGNNCNIRLATARAGNVIGGGDWAQNRIVSDCYRAWSIADLVAIRNPKAIRPWQHVLDPLFGYLLLGIALDRGNFLGEQFNFGPFGNQEHTVEQVVADLGVQWGFTSNENSYYLDTSTYFNESKILKLNCDKALSCLNWRSLLSYDETIKFTNDWYLAFYKQSTDLASITLQQIDHISHKQRKR